MCRQRRGKASRGGTSGPDLATGMSWHVALVVSCLGGLALPSMVWAQDGFYVTPSFSFFQVYDDNLLSTPSQAQSDRQADFISRFSPSLQAGYQSTPLTLLGRYGFEAEIFATHVERTTAQARQRASLDWQYLPSRLLTLSFIGAYVRTQTPRDINEATAVELGRARAQNYSASPSIVYRFDRLTTASTGYTFSQTEVSGGITTHTHSTNLGLDRQVTPRDTANLGYTFQLSQFGTEETTRSHAFTLGWTRQLTPLTSLALRAGPRFAEGSVGAEVSASLRQRLQRGQLSFTYTRSQGTIAGLAGAVKTDSFAAAMTYQPWRFLQVRAASRVSRSTRATFDTKVYGVSLTGTYQVDRWLSLQTSYQFNLQQGSTGFLAPGVERGHGDIYHNMFSVHLTITRPYRVY